MPIGQAAAIMANAMASLGDGIWPDHCPEGHSPLDELLKLVDADKAFPEKARQVFMGLFVDAARWPRKHGALGTLAIVAHARQDETARRLRRSLVADHRVADRNDRRQHDLLKSTRHLAVVRMVPRQYSTGGKTRLGRTLPTRQPGDCKLPGHRCHSMVYRAPQWNSSLGSWTRKLLERRPVRLVTVALANKMARMAWALMTRKEVYRAKGRVAAVTEAAV